MTDPERLADQFFESPPSAVTAASGPGRRWKPLPIAYGVWALVAGTFLATLFWFIMTPAQAAETNLLARLMPFALVAGGVGFLRGRRWGWVAVAWVLAVSFLNGGDAVQAAWPRYTTPTFVGSALWTAAAGLMLLGLYAPSVRAWCGVPSVGYRRGVITWGLLLLLIVLI